MSLKKIFMEFLKNFRPTLTKLSIAFRYYHFKVWSFLRWLLKFFWSLILRKIEKKMSIIEFWDLLSYLTLKIWKLTFKTVFHRQGRIFFFHKLQLIKLVMGNNSQINKWVNGFKVRYLQRSEFRVLKKP